MESIRRVVSDDSLVRKDRDESGRFAKGNKIGPAQRGRPARGDIMPILIAVTEEFSVDELRSMLRDTYNVARHDDDWKGMYAVINFVVQYAIGKPVQRSLSAQIDPDKIRELFQREEVMEDDEGDTIEVK